MSKADIGDMAAVGTVLVTGRLCEINQNMRLILYAAAWSNRVTKLVKQVIQIKATSPQT